MALIFRDVLNQQLGPARAYRLRMYIVTAAFAVAVLGIIAYSAPAVMSPYLVPLDCKPNEVVSDCKKRLDAVARVEKAAKALESMQKRRGIYLSPALEAYLVNPSPDGWKKVRDEAQTTLDASGGRRTPCTSTTPSCYRRLACSRKSTRAWKERPNPEPDHRHSVVPNDVSGDRL
jgi:hypothetical protein